MIFENGQSMNHELKIYKQFADAIINGDKTFEVRKNTRGFQAGDTVTFELKPPTETPHPIESKKYEIAYVMSGYGIEPNYVVFGIDEIEVDHA